MHSCKHSSGNAVNVRSVTPLTANSRTAIKTALQHGVVSVAVKTTDKFHSYDHGVFDESSCPTSTNHAVALVGYHGSEYWILRNSWGTSWGMNGYMYLAMHSGEGRCGCQKKPYKVGL
jgi:C1A family cysteine protease